MNYYDTILKLYFEKLWTNDFNNLFSVHKIIRTIIIIVIIWKGVIILILITYSYKYNNDYTIVHIWISVIIIESNIEENIDLRQFYNFKFR